MLEPIQAQFEYQSQIQHWRSEMGLGPIPSAIASVICLNNAIKIYNILSEHQTDAWCEYDLIDHDKTAATYKYKNFPW